MRNKPIPCKQCLVLAMCRTRIELKEVICCDTAYKWAIETNSQHAYDWVRKTFNCKVFRIGCSKEMSEELSKLFLVQEKKDEFERIRRQT